MHRIPSILLLSSCLSLPALAQQRQPAKEGEVDNQEITVEKSRKIELPPANRLFDKIQSVRPTPEQRKMTFEFDDRKLTVGDPKITPNVLAPTTGQADNTPAFGNYVRLGAGNYSSFLGEGYFGLNTLSNLALEGSVRHLSSGIGPVDRCRTDPSRTRLDRVFSPK